MRGCRGSWGMGWYGVTERGSLAINPFGQLDKKEPIAPPFLRRLLRSRELRHKQDSHVYKEAPHTYIYRIRTGHGRSYKFSIAKHGHT